MAQCYRALAVVIASMLRRLTGRSLLLLLLLLYYYCYCYNHAYSLNGAIPPPHTMCTVTLHTWLHGTRLLTLVSLPLYIHCTSRRHAWMCVVGGLDPRRRREFSAPAATVDAAVVADADASAETVNIGRQPLCGWRRTTNATS